MLSNFSTKNFLSFNTMLPTLFKLIQNLYNYSLVFKIVIKDFCRKFWKFKTDIEALNIC